MLEAAKEFCLDVPSLLDMCSARMAEENTLVYFALNGGQEMTEHLEAHGVCAQQINEVNVGSLEESQKSCRYFIDQKLKSAKSKGWKAVGLCLASSFSGISKAVAIVNLESLLEEQPRIFKMQIMYNGHSVVVRNEKDRAEAG